MTPRALPVCCFLLMTCVPVVAGTARTDPPKRFLSPPEVLEIVKKSEVQYRIITGMAFPRDYFTIFKKHAPALPPPDGLRYVGTTQNNPYANLVYVGNMQGYLRQVRQADCDGRVIES